MYKATFLVILPQPDLNHETTVNLNYLRRTQPGADIGTWAPRGTGARFFGGLHTTAQFPLGLQLPKQWISGATFLINIVSDLLFLIVSHLLFR